MALSVKILDDVTKCHDFNLKSTHQWMICPSPIVADALRTHLAIQEEKSVVETHTIAKFLNDVFSHYFVEKQVMRKSDLKLMLSVIWKARFQDKVYDDSLSFNQCFDILTDLRSYTLDFNLIESVLEHFTDNVSMCVKYFWFIMQEQEMIDEHVAYQMLYDYFSSSDIDNIFFEDTSLIFNGFSHLSMNQILFIKALSMRVDVVVPITRGVYEKRQLGDWVEWMVREADKLSGHDQKREAIAYPVDVIYYTKGKLTSLMTNLSRQENQSYDYIVVTKNDLSFEDSLIATGESTFFRVKSNILDESFKSIFSNLEKTFFTNQKEEILTSTFIDQVKKSIQYYLSLNKTFQVFSQIKVLALLSDRLEQWRELSSVNEKINHFDFLIIKEILQLDLPRVFNQPLIKNVKTVMISLKEVAMAVEKKNLICFMGDHDLSSDARASSYSFDVYQVLQTLGPTRRKSLDHELIIDLLFSTFKSGQTTLAIERGLEVHDAIVERLLKSIQINYLVLPKGIDRFENKEKQDRRLIDLDTEVEQLSASRMQAYIDCPRKYYYQYVKKISLEPEQFKTIDPRLLGSLQHKVVELYCSDFNHWDDGSLKSLIQETMENFFSSDLLKYSYVAQEIFVETYFFTKDLCQNLIRLKSLDNDMKYHFEVDLKEYGGVGSVDLLVESPLYGSMLLDIKRSGGSIPSKKKFEELMSIQLWHYAYFLNKKDISMFGYLNLSDVGQSLLFCLNETIQDKLFELNFLGIEKYEKLRGSFSQTTQDYGELYRSTIEKLNQNSFIIDPVDNQVCTFCPGTMICPKQ